jgi:hypothetical protein
MRNTCRPHGSFTTLALLALLISLLGFVGATPAAHAQFNVPSDGSDGAFNPTQNITIDLGTAKTATWDTPADYNLQGVYDPEQWIVVYKFTSVNIPSNVTVTFKNHPKNPPVVWLVQGNVAINGKLRLDGVAQGQFASAPPQGGPGGFRGGGWSPTTGGFGWSARNQSDAGPLSMPGNAGCFPLFGGSGMAFSIEPGAGDSGGGAILIAAGTQIMGAGEVTARGNGGGGGMVRLVAPVVSLATCRADGSQAGRIRVEANSIAIPASNPGYSAAPLPTSFVFLRHALTPSIRVVSIGGVAAPADPTGAFASPTDVVVPNPLVQIVLECKNVPSNATVEVELRSATNTNYTKVAATFQSGNLDQSTWIANGNLGTSLGYATVMARAVLPNP